MASKDRIATNLGKAEDLIFRARQSVLKDNNVDAYGMLDNALLMIQGVSMILSLKSDHHNGTGNTSA